MEYNTLLSSVKNSPNQLVKQYIEKNSLKQSFLSEKLSTSQSNVSKMLANTDMYVSALYDLCIALEVDFFAEMSMQLPSHIRSKSSKSPNRLSDLEIAVIDLVKRNFK